MLLTANKKYGNTVPFLYFIDNSLLFHHIIQPDLSVVDLGDLENIYPFSISNL